MSAPVARPCRAVETDFFQQHIQAGFIGVRLRYMPGKVRYSQALVKFKTTGLPQILPDLLYDLVIFILKNRNHAIHKITGTYPVRVDEGALSNYLRAAHRGNHGHALPVCPQQPVP